MGKRGMLYSLYWALPHMAHVHGLGKTKRGRSNNHWGRRLHMPHLVHFLFMIQCLFNHPQLYPLLTWGGWTSILQGAAREKEPRELQLISSSEGDSSSRGKGQQTQRLGHWSPQFLSLRRTGWCCIQFGPQPAEENEIRWCIKEGANNLELFM